MYVMNRTDAEGIILNGGGGGKGGGDMVQSRAEGLGLRVSQRLF